MKEFKINKLIFILNDQFKMKDVLAVKKARLEKFGENYVSS